MALVLASLTARRMRKPQPHLGPSEVPLRKCFLLFGDDGMLETGWEEWAQMAPASQVRPLVAQQRKLYVKTFGKHLGSEDAPHTEGEADEPQQLRRDQLRERQWQALPRELKLAIKRVHVNLGHAPVPAMLRALRVSRASEVAIRACRLFKCPQCPRARPKLPRPSKVPVAEDFNIQIGLTQMAVPGHG